MELQTIWIIILVALAAYSIGRLHEHISHVKRNDFIEGRGNYPNEPEYKKKPF